MTRAFTFVGSAVAAVVFGASAHAACGGGGYTPSKKASKDSNNSAQTSRTSEARFDGNRNSNQILIRRLSMADFDQIRPQLKLTEEQTAKIKELEADIKKKGDDAIAQVKSYDGKEDFEKRVVEILTPEQKTTYTSTKVANLR